MKEIEVKVIKYQTEDGKIFDNPNEAEYHERILKGTQRIYQYCNSTDSVLSGDDRYMEPCHDCNKKVWQENVEVWK